MKYMTIRLTPRRPKEFIITCFINPWQEEKLSEGDGERMLAIDQVLRHAQDLIETAYDIKFQTREWECEEKD